MVVKGEEVGLSSERLARIDDHLVRRYIEPAKLAGTLTAVWRKGHLAHFSALGLRDRERKAPMTEDTVFRIYSMTKPITSVALMILYERAELHLEDPVHRFIPEWKDLRVYKSGNQPRWETVPCERPMTVRDLLTHTSGLTYGFQERTNVDAAYRKHGIGAGGATYDGSLEKMCSQLAGIPLEFSPGTRWNYSVSTDIVGRVVEVVSGRSLDRFFRDEILEPLDMPDTGFFVREENVERFAACYERRMFRKETWLQDDPTTSPYIKRRPLLSGGGGLVSTARDYLRFCEMLIRGGELDGKRILGRKTVELMTMNHLPGGSDVATLATGRFAETRMEGVGFGLGFSVSLDPAKSHVSGTPGELSWGGAASTIFWIDPAEDLIFVFLTQLLPSRAFNLRTQLKQLVYAAIVD